MAVCSVAADQFSVRFVDGGENREEIVEVELAVFVALAVDDDAFEPLGAVICFDTDVGVGAAVATGLAPAAEARFLGQEREGCRRRPASLAA